MTDTQMGRIENAVNTHSRPSELRITDMRVAVVAALYDFPIIKIKVGTGRDAERVGAVRDAVPDAQLVVDALQPPHKPLAQQLYLG